MEYLDFDLQVGLLENGQYPLSVRSPAGEASDSFTFPYNEWQLKDKLKDLELALRASPHLRRALPPELQSVQDMGRDFFNLLLPGELRARFDVSQRMASEQGKGLRVRLRIRSPELGALPWEYLYDPRQGEYLCLSSYTPIIRYLELPQPILPLEITLPLRVLGMACSPTNLAELDVDQEKQRIEEALAPLQRDGLVTLQWLEGSTWRDLQRAISAAEHAGAGWHVFHFIGHGDFDELADEGRVAFARENSSAHFLSATELARLLADHHSLRLVLLNACEGALGSLQDAFSSTAATLVRRGIATVIAMQRTVSDQAAIELARTFYENLAEGAPVDTALCEARKAISLALPRSLEWGTPVLFMRAADGVLFRIAEEGQAVKPLDRAWKQVFINTGGAPYIEGNVSTGGGDIIGQDKVMTGRGEGQQSLPVPVQSADVSSPQDIRSIKRPAVSFLSKILERVPKDKRWLYGIAGVIGALLLLWGSYFLFSLISDKFWGISFVPSLAPTHTVTPTQLTTQISTPPIYNPSNTPIPNLAPSITFTPFLTPTITATSILSATSTPMLTPSPTSTIDETATKQASDMLEAQSQYQTAMLTWSANLYDTFDTNEGWNVQTVNEDTYQFSKKITSGGYIFDLTTRENRVSSWDDISPIKSTYDVYLASMDIKVDPSSSVDALEIGLNILQKPSLDRLMIKIYSLSSIPSLSVYKWTPPPSKSTFYFKGQFPKTYWIQDQFNRISVLCTGNSLIYFINGNYIAKDDNASFAINSFVPYISLNNWNSHALVEFDNAILRVP